MLKLAKKHKKTPSNVHIHHYICSLYEYSTHYYHVFKPKSHLMIINEAQDKVVEEAVIIILSFPPSFLLPHSATMHDFHYSTDIFVNPSFLPFCSQQAP